jgi:hypothetical protein
MLAFGSQIGGLDRMQHVDIPAQTLACRVEISAHHKTAEGWEGDRGAILEDTPNNFEIGFCDPSSTAAQEDDVSRSLVFSRLAPIDGRR